MTATINSAVGPKYVVVYVLEDLMSKIMRLYIPAGVLFNTTACARHFQDVFSKALRSTFCRYDMALWLIRPKNWKIFHVLRSQLHHLLNNCYNLSFCLNIVPLFPIVSVLTAPVSYLSSWTFFVTGLSTRPYLFLWFYYTILGNLRNLHYVSYTIPTSVSLLKNAFWQFATKKTCQLFLLI